MDPLLRNVRLAFRTLCRAPGFALTAIVTLALGIGLSTAVFTVADAMLLRRLPVAAQDDLVVLWGRTPDQRFDNFPMSIRDAREFASGTRALERTALVAYEGARPAAIRDGDRITRLRRALVSGSYFEVLGARPALGRALTAEDDAVGAAPVAVLSHDVWQRDFGGEANVLGRRLLLHDSGTAHTIVGVMPQGLEHPRGADFWAPLIPERARAGPDSTTPSVHVIGRLAPGATPEHARDELTAFHARADRPAGMPELHGVAQTLPRIILGDTRSAVLAFAVASALLLLITCLDVANLLLVRGLARVREVAVRTALGAGRRQVIAQLLTENALLAVAGGALGVLIASMAVDGFVAFAPGGLPRIGEIALNATAIAAATGITALAMLIFALAPAVLTSRVELQPVLRSGTRQTAGRGARFATEALVAGQVALAVIVLSAAGLIGRSLIALERAELSLDPEPLLIAELALRHDQYGDKARQMAMLDVLVPELEALSGVVAVSPVVAVPFSGSGGWDGRPAAETQSAQDAASNPILNMEVVGPRYFETLGVPVVQGRSFSNADREGAPGVIILSESAARHYWPGESPLGKRLRLGPPSAPLFTVVGIVPDTRYRDLRDARASIYFPLRQSFFPFTPTTLAIRTSRPSAEVVPALRRAISETAPGVALASAAPFDAFLGEPLAQPRLNAFLLAVFAGAAVALAAVGLFSVMAAMVRQRRRELGVRLALGATVGDLRRMVLRRGLLIAAVGTGAGLVGAVVANRLLVAMLYEVSPTDVATLAMVSVLLLIVAALASALPARASTRINPSIALRADW